MHDTIRNRSRRRAARLFPVAGVLALVVAAVPLAGGCASFNAAMGDVLQTGPLDESTIIAGLREALRVGTDRTVESTSRVDGFFENPRIRIPLPSELKTVASTLRSVGMGSTVDEFELAMNRAAEEASGEAVDVFWNAIKAMTWQDARGILEGSDTAATEYFRGKTWEELETRFSPIVTRKMDELGYVRTYESLVDAYDALPLTTKPAFDPYAYVTDRALGGLFTILGDEEKRIREDPAARTTALLRQVFGSGS